MSRKPRFKVQVKNPKTPYDLELYGNKNWLAVFDNNQRLGYTLTFEEATALYWRMKAIHPDVTYRITEKR